MEGKHRSTFTNILLVITILIGIFIYINHVNKEPNTDLDKIKELEIENSNLKKKYIELEKMYDSLYVIKNKKIIEIKEIEKNEKIKKDQVSKLSDSSSVNYFIDYTRRYSISRD